MNTHRWIAADVLRHAGRLAGGVVHGVAEDARRGGLLGEVAGAARKHELAVDLVLLGVQHVAALGAKAERDLFDRLLTVARGRGCRRRHCYCDGDELAAACLAG